MSRILLLLDQKENRHLLGEELGRDHEVVDGATGAGLAQDFDLLVVDGHALDRLGARVEERRRSERPLYLPVLLVTSRPNVKMITRDLWRSVDELIITPIEKIELRARIQVLLRVREQSLELRERAEAAERAVATRDDVMAMVSHDLRNPLNVVLTHASLLLELGTGLDTRQRDQLRAIHRAVTQMSLLTQDLLDVSALEAGTVKIRPGPVDVGKLVRGACEQHGSVAEGAKVSLACDVDDDLPFLMADRGRLDQLFGNLIGNAIKFTPAEGSVVLRARCEGDRVRFTVSDTGPGLTEREAAQAFDRFWRGDPAQSSGAGLGLTIAKAIVEAHGGTIGVESVPGEGASFWFEIPAGGE